MSEVDVVQRLSISGSNAIQGSFKRAKSKLADPLAQFLSPIIGQDAGSINLSEIATQQGLSELDLREKLERLKGWVEKGRRAREIFNLVRPDQVEEGSYDLGYRGDEKMFLLEQANIDLGDNTILNYQAAIVELIKMFPCAEKNFPALPADRQRG
ncbi:MAG: hypothetical protein FWE16_00015 [Firmicutes bacterium]|nr:hypothetical protein [Bacillota bacterium]